MCVISNIYNHSFKWITYLVIVLGVYTFLHWFLAVPLLYSHFHECCNEKWPNNWILWFLGISFVFWLGICILIVSIWFCAILCKTRHLNESSVWLTGKENKIEGKQPEIDKTDVKSSESVKGSTEEIITTPDIKPSDNIAVFEMNDRQFDDSPIAKLDFPIPLEETHCYVQKDSPQVEEPQEEEIVEKPLKTPREIFFKDLIEAASKSSTYFEFDPEKISQDFRKKCDLEEESKLKADEKPETDGKSFFVGSQTEKENMTSEVLITLNEKGVMVEKLGEFQILKD